jgi:hypothetical protein
MSAVPQSSQNTEEGAFSAPHFGQRLDSGLPHAAQNFLPVALSVPHFEHCIATTFPEADEYRAWTGQLVDTSLDSGSELAKCPHDQIDPTIWSVANNARTQLRLAQAETAAHTAPAPTLERTPPRAIPKRKS